MKLFGWLTPNRQLREEITRLRLENIDLQSERDSARFGRDMYSEQMERLEIALKQQKHEFEAKYADELQKRLELAKLVMELEAAGASARPTEITCEELEIVELQSESYIDREDLGYFNEAIMKNLLASNLGQQILPYIRYRNEEQGDRTMIRASVSVIMRTEDDKRDD